jgi:hypothetical protein
MRQGTLRRSTEDHWVPLSDLMTGLMMTFLVIAILFMIKVEREAKQAELQATQIKEQAETIKAIAALYGDVRAKIYDEMYRAFKDDLPVWHAALLLTTKSMKGFCWRSDDRRVITYELASIH